MEETEVLEETVSPESEHAEASHIVETIVNNGVSREELREMLNDILKPEIEAHEIENAEREYFDSFLKGGYR